MVKEIGGGKDPPLAVSKDMATRSVLVCGRRILFISKEQLVWTRDGAARYAEEERGMIAVFATSF